MGEEKKKKMFDTKMLVERDLLDKGYTDKKCPFCGTSLKIEGNLVSHRITCEKEGCFKYDIRGL